MASSVPPAAPEASAAEHPSMDLEGFDLDLAHLGREQIAAFYTRGVEAIVALITAILGVVQHLLHENQALRERVAELEHQLHRDSHNSSKPPSSDGYAKRRAKPRRERSGRKPGAQQGHVGTTLAPVDNPDVIVHHPVDHCEKCERDLRDVAPVNFRRRQVFDLPRHPWVVTEHRVDIKICPDCTPQNTAAFPAGVDAPVQYGPEVLAHIGYMHCYPWIPIERIREWFRDEWHLPLSTGPIMRSLRQIAERLTPIMETVRIAVPQDPHPVCVDETGMRGTGGQWWFPGVSTPR